MEKAKKISIVLVLVGALCFGLVQFLQAKRPQPEPSGVPKVPIWQITQDGTDISIEWEDADNARFAFYDYNTPEDPTDDLVLDKETRLIYERSPRTVSKTWLYALDTCANQELGGRKGWRLPTFTELASLIDRSILSGPTLPSDHPFENVMTSFYWTATTRAVDPTEARKVGFADGDVFADPKTNSNLVWCVYGSVSGPDIY